jgi:hypothetical protein
MNQQHQPLQQPVTHAYLTTYSSAAKQHVVMAAL